VQDIPAGDPPAVPIEFGTLEWGEEVERYDPRSPARTRAQSARFYVPLGKEGASQAPYGFVFQLVQKPDDSLAWSLIAFGERHPSNERTRNVYERAHKRLHGRYP
jgi:hypothetical protein